MRKNSYRKVTLPFVFFLVALPATYATPSIQITSPANTTYSETGPILINVTSNETVDFFIRLNKRNITVANNTMNYTSYYYGSNGSHHFKIYANNSNGEAYDDVYFTINHSSVINVTTCGELASPNTTYVLQNNISSVPGGYGPCIILLEREPEVAEESCEDSILDLNGFTIDSDHTAIVGSCVNSQIINGNLYSYFYGVGIDIDGYKCHITNVSFDWPLIGVWAHYISDSLLETLEMNNVETGIYLDNFKNIMVKNTSINSRPIPQGVAVKVFGESAATLNIENTNATGFLGLWLGTNYVDIFLKNAKINTDDFITEELPGTTRIFTMHRLILHVTDGQGNGVPASVEIVDNGIFPRTDEERNQYTLKSNPTGRLFLATDENGTVDKWIAQKLKLITIRSPQVTEEYSFGNYTFIIRAGSSVNETGQINVDINSTLELNFTMPPLLPDCTITQLLDLNNDGSVSIQDAVFVLRKIVGLPVSSTGKKNCNALNLFAG